jgi:hypothetical protein
MVETIAFVSERNGGSTLRRVQSGVSPTGREAAYLNLSVEQTPADGASAAAGLVHNARQAGSTILVGAHRRS